MTTTDIPAGFEPHSRKSPLTDPWEPIYSKRTADAIILGVAAGTPHTNARGLIHGGLIAALADNAMGHSCGHKMTRRRFARDRQLAVDFSAAPRSDNGLRSRAR